MKVRALHHVGLVVDDLAAAERFYCDTLGLPLRDRPEGMGPGLWIDLGSQRIDLGPHRGHSSGYEGDHVAIAVDDIEETVQRVRDAGVEVTELIAPMMIAMFQDPAGNWIELRRPPEDWAAWADRSPS